MLRNGVYCGKPLPVFRKSKPDKEGVVLEPVQISAHAPTYVTPTEAARVHAILKQNAAHSGRPRGRDYGTLLHGGLAYCAYCGHRLDLVIVVRAVRQEPMLRPRKFKAWWRIGSTSHDLFP